MQNQVRGSLQTSVTRTAHLEVKRLTAGHLQLRVIDCPENQSEYSPVAALVAAAAAEVSVGWELSEAGLESAVAAFPCWWGKPLGAVGPELAWARKKVSA